MFSKLKSIFTRCVEWVKSFFVKKEEITREEYVISQLSEKAADTIKQYVIDYNGPSIEELDSIEEEAGQDEEKLLSLKDAAKKAFIYNAFGPAYLKTVACAKDSYEEMIRINSINALAEEGIDKYEDILNIQDFINSNKVFDELNGNMEKAISLSRSFDELVAIENEIPDNVVNIR